MEPQLLVSLAILEFKKINTEIMRVILLLGLIHGTCTGAKELVTKEEILML